MIFVCVCVRLFMCMTLVFCRYLNNATMDQKRININYTTKLNHRTHTATDSPAQKAYRRARNSLWKHTLFTVYISKLKGCVRMCWCMESLRLNHALLSHHRWQAWSGVSISQNGLLATNPTEASQWDWRVQSVLFFNSFLVDHKSSGDFGIAVARNVDTVHRLIPYIKCNS